MSIRVMQAVWEHSAQSGGALVLLLAIADNAHDDGDGAYPSVETLAKKARMTGRNVQLLLKQLAAAGEITIRPNAGPNGVNVYRVMLPGLSPPEKISPPKRFHPETVGKEGVKNPVRGDEKSGSQGVKPVSPKPSLNRQREPLVKPSLSEDQFARFWAVYPKRKKRAEAEAWFAKHQPDAALVGVMVAAIGRARQGADWQAEAGRFIPLAVSWLNGRRWEDEDDDPLTTPQADNISNLIGKDRERAEVMRRVLARRGIHGPDRLDADPATHGGGVPRLTHRTRA